MKKIYMLCAVLLISACSSNTYETTESEVLMSEKQTAFNVEKITLTSIYKQVPQEPYIDHLMDVTPDKMTREWLKSRFVVGQETPDSRLEVFIKESSITQKPVLRNGVKDTEYAVYRANISLEIKVIQSNQVVGAVFSKAFEERIVENYLSITEKNKVWENLVYTALDKADIELEIGIKRYLNKYTSK